MKRTLACWFALTASTSFSKVTVRKGNVAEVVGETSSERLVVNCPLLFNTWNCVEMEDHRN